MFRSWVQVPLEEPRAAALNWQIPLLRLRRIGSHSAAMRPQLGSFTTQLGGPFLIILLTNLMCYTFDYCVLAAEPQGLPNVPSYYARLPLRVDQGNNVRPHGRIALSGSRRSRLASNLWQA